MDDRTFIDIIKEADRQLEKRLAEAPEKIKRLEKQYEQLDRVYNDMSFFTKHFTLKGWALKKQIKNIALEILILDEW